MIDVHQSLALAAAAGTGAVFVASAALAAGLAVSLVWLDRAILVQLATGLATGLVGLAVAAVSEPPADPLHLLYGAVLVSLPVGGRYATRRADPRRIGRAMAVVSLVTLGVAVRAFMTGGG